MNTLTLQAAQNDIVRSVLNTYSIDTLNKIKQLLKREEQKTEDIEEAVFSDQEVLSNFDQSCKELKLSLDGKLELKSWEEALNEL